MGMRWAVPLRSGSVVAYEYHQPSRPRTTAGSAKVSANCLVTGLAELPDEAGAAPAGVASVPAASATAAPMAASTDVRRPRRVIAGLLKRPGSARFPDCRCGCTTL